MNKFKKAKKDVTDKEFSHFQFKINRELWDKFKIKVIRDGCPTYRDKIEELIKKYVHT